LKVDFFHVLRSRNHLANKANEASRLEAGKIRINGGITIILYPLIFFMNYYPKFVIKPRFIDKWQHKFTMVGRDIRWSNSPVHSHTLHLNWEQAHMLFCSLTMDEGGIFLDASPAIPRSSLCLVLVYSEHFPPGSCLFWWFQSGSHPWEELVGQALHLREEFLWCGRNFCGPVAVVSQWLLTVNLNFTVVFVYDCSVEVLAWVCGI